MESLKRRKLDRISAAVIALLVLGLCAAGYLAFAPGNGRTPAPGQQAAGKTVAVKTTLPHAEAPDPLPPAAAGTNTASVKPPFKICGIIYSCDSPAGSTVWVDHAGKVAIYGVGDRLADGWVVASIEAESARFIRDGEAAILSLDRTGLAAPVAAGTGSATRAAPARNYGAIAYAPALSKGREGPEVPVSASVSGARRAAPPPDAANSDAIVAVDPGIADIAREAPLSLMQGVNLEPRIQKGRMDGIQLNLVPSGSMAARYGLATGDVILAVNDKPIASVQDAWNLYTQLRDSSAVNVTILRAGKKKVVTYYVR